MASNDFSYDYNNIYKRVLIVFKALAIAMNIILTFFLYSLLIKFDQINSIDVSKFLSNF